MDIVVFDPNELPVALGALRGLVARPSARQKRFLESVSRLHGRGVRADRIWPAPLSLVAASIRDAHKRKRLVQLAIVLSMVDERVEPRAAAAVAELARALDVEEPAVRTLPKLAAGHALRTRVDVTGRILGKFFSEAWRDTGLSGVRGILADFVGVGADDALAARYAQLSQYPSDSLGGALWQHCTSRNFALPGARAAIPERILFHDVGHVLSGYDTDPAGEIQQAAFQAGFVRKDGFGFLFFGLLQFHLGIQITPVAEPAVGLFDIEKVMTALARGAQCKVDLSDNWDFWSVAALPLKQVCAELGIPPQSTGAGFASARRQAREPQLQVGSRSLG